MLKIEDYTTGTNQENKRENKVFQKIYKTANTLFEIIIN